MITIGLFTDLNNCRRRRLTMDAIGSSFEIVNSWKNRVLIIVKVIWRIKRGRIMFCRMLLAVGFVAGFLFPVRINAQSIDGNWAVQSGVLNGKKVPDIALTSMALNINSTKFEARSGSFASMGTISANTLVLPAQIEFSIENGADTGRKLKAVFALENGQLKVTFSQDDQFPTSFESTDANRYLALIYAPGQATSATNTSASTTSTPPVAENQLPPKAGKNRRNRAPLSPALPGGGG